MAALPASADAGSVRVQWDPNEDLATVGYKVHLGSESRTYDEVIDVGLATEADLARPAAGSVRYCAVTAYNILGQDSEFSEEVAIAGEKVEAQVTLAGLTAIYDGLPKEVSAGTSPSGLAVELLYDGSDAPPVKAGVYQVHATIQDPAYQGSAEAVLTIGKAPATIEFLGLKARYDGSPKVVSVVTSPPGLAVELTYDGGSDPPAEVGNHSVAAVIKENNFSGSSSGTLVISREGATLELIGTDATYDGMPKAVTAITSPPGLEVEITYDGHSEPPVGAGTYQVEAVVLEAGYDAAASGSLVIRKAHATIEVSNLETTYDGTAKEPAVTTTPPGLAVDLSFDELLTVPTAAGSYPFEAVVRDANYRGTATATLEIRKAKATVTLDDLTRSFDGTPQRPSVATVPAGLPVNITYEGSSDAPAEAGVYAVVATVDHPDHEGSADGLLVIEKGQATVELKDLAAVYDGMPHAVKVTTNPPGLKVRVTYDGSTVPPRSVGVHDVAAVVIDANYQGEATAELVIEKATVALGLGNLVAAYDGTAKTVTVSPPGNLPGAGTLVYDAWTKTLTSSSSTGGIGYEITYNGETTPPVAAGTYLVHATVVHPVYQGEAYGIFEISKAPAVIRLAGLVAEYDGQPKPVAVTTDPPGLATSITYAGAGTPPAMPGSYPIVASIFDPNYEGSAQAVMTIDAGEAGARLLMEAWTGAASLDGARAAPDATPHADGVPNLLKYAFNLDATRPDATRLKPGAGSIRGLPAVGLERNGGQPDLRVEFLRRKGSGLIYRPEFSADLLTWHPAEEAPAVEPIDDEWERVVARGPSGGETSPYRFGRVVVELP